jgi:hypothetical protein
VVDAGAVAKAARDLIGLQGEQVAAATLVEVLAARRRFERRRGPAARRGPRDCARSRAFTASCFPRSARSVTPVRWSGSVAVGGKRSGEGAGSASCRRPDRCGRGGEGAGCRRRRAGQAGREAASSAAGTVRTRSRSSYPGGASSRIYSGYRRWARTKSTTRADLAELVAEIRREQDDARRALRTGRGGRTGDRADRDWIRGFAGRVGDRKDRARRELASLARSPPRRHPYCRAGTSVQSFEKSVATADERADCALPSPTRPPVCPSGSRARQRARA